MAAIIPDRFFLQPTKHSPNSPLPILLYRKVLPEPYSEESTTKFLEKNDWEKRGTWGHIGMRHFHPNTHECYGIFRGSSTMLLGRGVKDERGGIEIPVSVGDVIVLPAGTTHCNVESTDGYRYIGVYPKEAPKWVNEFGKKPIDLPSFRKQTMSVGVPGLDPVYGKDGPLPSIWKHAEDAFTGDSVRANL